MSFIHFVEAEASALLTTLTSGVNLGRKILSSQDISVIYELTAAPSPK